MYFEQAKHQWLSRASSCRFDRDTFLQEAVKRPVRPFTLPHLASGNNSATAISSFNSATKVCSTLQSPLAISMFAREAEPLLSYYLPNSIHCVASGSRYLIPPAS
jgi:hypothetical protein